MIEATLAGKFAEAGSHDGSRLSHDPARGERRHPRRRRLPPLPTTPITIRPESSKIPPPCSPKASAARHHRHLPSHPTTLHPPRRPRRLQQEARPNTSRTLQSGRSIMTSRSR